MFVNHPFFRDIDFPPSPLSLFTPPLSLCQTVVQPPARKERKYFSLLSYISIYMYTTPTHWDTHTHTHKYHHIYVLDTNILYFLWGKIGSSCFPRYPRSQTSELTSLALSENFNFSGMKLLECAREIHSKGCLKHFVCFSPLFLFFILSFLTHTNTHSTRHKKKNNKKKQWEKKYWTHFCLSLWVWHQNWVNSKLYIVCFWNCLPLSPPPPVFSLFIPNFAILTQSAGIWWFFFLFLLVQCRIIF